MIDKNIVLAFAAGAVAGVLGARYYKQHQADIDDKLNALRAKLQEGAGLMGGAAPEQAAEPAAAASAAQESELTLEELEAQKERLEDLIAELQANAKQGPAANEPGTAQP